MRHNVPRDVEAHITSLIILILNNNFFLHLYCKFPLYTLSIDFCQCRYYKKYISLYHKNTISINIFYKLLIFVIEIDLLIIISCLDSIIWKVSSPLISLGFYPIFFSIWHCHYLLLYTRFQLLMLMDAVASEDSPIYKSLKLGTKTGKETNLLKFFLQRHHEIIAY